MPGNASQIDLESLLRHADFVRSVARRLVLDEHQVDDVMQQTWLAAIQSPAPRKALLRGWLARVARNRAADLMRGERRRARRERAVARPDRAPSAAQALERFTLHRQVVDAVLALEEPYGSTVVLRFYDELPPREIAAIQGVPVATVRTRLRRAIELLRTNLDDKFGGDRRAWRLALLPLVLPAQAATAGGGVALALSGVLIMKKIVLVAVALCVMAASITVWQAGRERTETVRSQTPRVDAAVRGMPKSKSAGQVPDAPAGAPTVAEIGGPSRVAPTEERPYRIAEETGDPDGATLRVVVTDESGRPRPDVPIHVLLIKDGVGKAGSEVLTNVAGRAELSSLDPDTTTYAALRVGRLYRTTPIELVGGRVTELAIPIPESAVIEGEIRHLEKGTLAGISIDLERKVGTFRDYLHGTTDETGRYRIPDVPPGTWNVALKGEWIGYSPRPRTHLVVTGPGILARDFVLGRLSLQGVVRDASTGLPLPDARVALSDLYISATTDAQGMFQFTDIPTGNYRLSLSKDGYVSVGVDAGGVTEGETKTVDGSLNPAALLHVHVHDSEGRPVVGRLRLWLRQGLRTSYTSVTTDEEGHALYRKIAPGPYDISIAVAPSGDPTASRSEWVHVEVEAGGNSVELVLERKALESDSRHSLWGTVVDATTREPVPGVRVAVTQPPAHESQTDHRGSFSLGELPPGEYTVWATKDGYGTRLFNKVRVGAGESCALRIEMHPAGTLHVQVSDGGGRPVTGRVFLGITPLGDRIDEGLGTSRMADAEGRIVYPRLAPGRYRLRFSAAEHGKAVIETEIRPGENSLKIRLE